MHGGRFRAAAGAYFVSVVGVVGYESSFVLCAVDERQPVLIINCDVVGWRKTEAT